MTSLTLAMPWCYECQCYHHVTAGHIGMPVTAGHIGMPGSKPGIPLKTLYEEVLTLRLLVLNAMQRRLLGSE